MGSIPTVGTNFSIMNLNIKPQKTIKGITFFPIPQIPDFAGEACYFPRRDRPDVPRKYRTMAASLFFEGGTLPPMQAQIDRNKAVQAVAGWLRSFATAHEVKEDTVGYALWLWCEGDLS